ncbi:thiamine phosphate synthase [Dyella nitratireducens]|uniref:Thiamine-phosphate synthase n=1 Tax=Dyella nitratireducens TaxID=1849580 RepID=A0ABQ1GFH3_9GAMM|nr:thiamine phosphate synthase [Dyella nitratireducens]GGA42606.1 thiamine-phosphate synthase [Dyella nitratireducens]GLQ41980.1 thiamine-phosphate synthase [Dyella nitratireducens]
MKKPFDLSLYLVLDPDLCQRHSMVETAREAVAGGVTVVQVRHKHASTAERIALARSVKDALRDTSALVVMNDDIDAAIAAEVDAVHIGQRDMPPALARERIGPDMLLGLSVNVESAAQAVDPRVVDYAGIGPVFATPTKPDHEQPIGFDGLARIVAVCPVPTVAIGGLKRQHVSDVFAAGAHGLAVVSAICGTPDPRQSAAKLWAAIGQAHSGL